MPPLFSTTPRTVVVAVDHPLYSWPVAGLEDRRGLLETVVSAGADAVIATYGTLRDCSEALAGCTKIMKLDLATLSVGAYRDSEFRLGWTVVVLVAEGPHRDRREEVGSQEGAGVVLRCLRFRFAHRSTPSRVVCAERRGASRSGLPDQGSERSLE